MDWIEANLSLQYATELRVGALMRRAAEQAKAEEDAAFAALRGVVGAG